MRLNKLALFLSVLTLSFGFMACGGGAEKTEENKRKEYETIENDPTNTRIYTLDNGLKVYLSVNQA
jgi:hypothetical protein